MAEGRGAIMVADGRVDRRLVPQVIEAAAQSPRNDRVHSCLEAMIDAAEQDPNQTREALWALRSDHATLERLERCLDLKPTRATLVLGAALQLIHEELSSPAPDLRNRKPELLRWVEGGW